jgi:hypothetical protein
MNHWWRAYNEAVDDPKLILLSDKAHRAWFNLMCVASANAGILPEIKFIAVKLRITPQQASSIIAELVQADLVDRRDDGHFEPHNWNGRQYKSDVSTERVKRFRKRERNVSSDVSETPPETETETETEADKAEAIASGAEAPDPRTRLFREGLATVGRLTGKGPDSCRSFVGKCLKEAGDDAVVVLGLIEDAERNRVVDPSAWIARCLKGRKANGNGPTGEISAAGSSLIERLNAGFGGTSPQEYSGSGASEADARLLSYGRS